jgi:hypothetical protein
MEFQGHPVRRGVIIGVGQRRDSRVIGEADGQGNGLPEMWGLAQTLRGLAGRKLPLGNDSFGVRRTIRGLFAESRI